MAHDQIDGDPPREQLDIVRGHGLLGEHLGYRPPGAIGGVDDATMAVPAFHGEVKFPLLDAVLVFAQVEVDPLGYQPLHAAATVVDREFHRLAVAQAGAGGQGVLHVGVDGVAGVQYGGHAALGPVGGTLVQLPFANERDAQVCGQVQGQTQAGCVGADDEHVVLV